MPFDRPTLTALIERILTDMGTRIDGADTTLARGNVTALSRVHAGATHTLHGYLRWLSDQLMVDLSESEYLERQAAIWGVTRTPATKATGNAEATGTTGTLIPAGTVLQRSDGVEFTTDADVTLAAGTGTLALTASTGGDDGNTTAAASLSFMSPIAGVDTTATVDSSGLTGGVNEETDAALRLRVLSRIQEPPHGGAGADYVKWAKEVAGVTRAWAYDRWLGLGTVGVTFVRDDDGTGTAIIPDTTELAAVESYIDEHTDPATGQTVGRPVTADVTVFAPTAKTVDFAIALTVGDGYDEATVQANIQTELEDFLFREGEPDSTLYISRINEAISLATGEFTHTLTSPAADVVVAQNEIALMGTITWS